MSELIPQTEEKISLLEKRQQLKKLAEELDLDPINLAMFFAETVKEMDPLDRDNFNSVVEYAKVRKVRKEWLLVFYYLASVAVVDLLKDSADKEKRKRAKEVFDIIKESCDELEKAIALGSLKETFSSSST